MKLPLAPRGLHHAFEALTGAALEHRGMAWTHGITPGRHHVGWMTRWRLRDVGRSAYAEGEDARMGLDWSAQKDNVDWQLAWAWTFTKGWLLRTSFRWARGTHWVVQGVYEGGWRQGERQWNTFSTWQHPEHGGLVQTRVRIRGREDWDVRFGQPHKRSVWRWSMWGTHETFMGGIHLRHEAKASWWMGRDRSGNRGGHVEGRGVKVVCGNGAYLRWMVKALAVPSWFVRLMAVWSRTPNMGWRMGLVTNNGLARHRGRRNARGHFSTRDLLAWRWPEREG